MKITLYELTNILGSNTKVNLFEDGRIACDSFNVYSYGADFEAQEYGSCEVECVDPIGKDEANVYVKKLGN